MIVIDEWDWSVVKKQIESLLLVNLCVQVFGIFDTVVLGCEQPVNTCVKVKTWMILDYLNLRLGES